jgi:hypothetical protein
VAVDMSTTIALKNKENTKAQNRTFPGPVSRTMVDFI